MNSMDCIQTVMVMLSKYQSPAINKLTTGEERGKVSTSMPFFFFFLMQLMVRRKHYKQPGLS